jgi:hypothetical protein
MLALLALALQFGVTWGHFHSDGLFKPTATELTFQPASTDTGHAQDADRTLCPICVTVAMVASALDAASPPLTLPPDFAIRSADPRDTAPTLAQRRALFQSRAPPLA